MLHHRINDWFAGIARDLPWRDPHCSPWGVLVSEIMLQQTPVVRVLPVWHEWLKRWPTPAGLAGEPAGEAVRSWGRLGYPRRALRLHASATAIVQDHAGHVPNTYTELLALPGVGSYTAAAVAAFAYGRRETVVDTNIRRVHARLVSGVALPAPALTAAEMRLAAALLPDDDETSVRWNAAVMELGALVCTARAPKCAACPVQDSCAWLAAGEPPPSYVPKGQAWHGTDRQVRGAVLAVLRAGRNPRAAGHVPARARRSWLCARRNRRAPCRAAPAQHRPGATGAGTGGAAGGRPCGDARRRLPAPRLTRLWHGHGTCREWHTSW
ncbi:A/G-specific adenine glycosylase [Arthrobacter sp. B2I5]|nr:A/G-specific adenine glycosylase [Arthrobacter sp. B2I5]